MQISLVDPLREVYALAETYSFIDFANHECFTRENRANTHPDYLKTGIPSIMTDQSTELLNRFC